MLCYWCCCYVVKYRPNFFLTFLLTFAPVGKLSLDFSNLSNFEPAFVLLMPGVSEIRDSTVLSERFSLLVVTFVVRKLLTFAPVVRNLRGNWPSIFQTSRISNQLLFFQC